MMGIATGSDDVALRLSDDSRSLNWRTVGKSDSADHVNVVDVDFVRAVGVKELCLVSATGDAILQVDAETNQ